LFSTQRVPLLSPTKTRLPETDGDEKIGPFVVNCQSRFSRFL